ncbi:anthrone oxygenase family protein [uncultured Sphingomonas sp.]|uniref:anthrone oxygenase family protein n=1 Tax=uncultured Sphingomonas sp. TaxID=158754 RepID=UPI0035C9E7F5
MATTSVVFVDGLLAGVFLGSCMVEHAARKLGAAAWIPYKQAKEAVFGPVMPIFFGIGLIVCVVAAVLTGRAAVIAAALLLVVVLAITAIVHLPLNKLFQTWSPTAFPADWDDSRRRWRDWNWVRGVLAVIAFGATLVA